jgi:hypothetical protein
MPIYSQLWITLGQSNERIKNEAARRSFANRLLEDLASPRSNCKKGLIGRLGLDFAFLRLPNVLQFFEVCGPSLTTLSLRGPFVAATVRDVLILCPNLQFLELIDISESCSFPVNTPVRLEKTLKKLRHVGFVGGPAASHVGYRDGHLDFLVSIVSSSPLLSSLTIKFGDDFGSFDRFMSGIAENVTMKLVHMRIGPCSSWLPYSRHVGSLLHFNYGPKFTTLLLSGMQDLMFPQPTEGKVVPSYMSGLNLLLKKVMDTLENLVLSKTYFLRYQNNVNPIFAPVPFPYMEKLLSFENWATDSFIISSLSVVKLFPNLNRLLLKGNNPGSFLQMLLARCDILLEKPHLNLKELYLRQFISSAFPLGIIVKAFPNLKKLEFALGEDPRILEQRLPKQVRDSEAVRLLRESITALTGLENLTELKLVMTYAYEPFILDTVLTELFVPKNFPSEFADFITQDN